MRDRLNWLCVLAATYLVLDCLARRPLGYYVVVPPAHPRRKAQR